MAKRGFFEGPFGRLVLPGIIMQSVLIGGGFATGREIVEYGAKYGARGWLGGVGIFLGFTVMAILTFELARRHHAYDYRTLLKRLIGPGWMAYDVVYLLLAILIIAVMASATGEILQATIGLPYGFGVMGMAVLVGILNFYGEYLIERFKSWGTLALLSGYTLFGTLVIATTGKNAWHVLVSGDTSFVPGPAPIGAILWSGVLYVGYNLAVYPAALFTVKRQRSRRDAVLSGLIAGLLMCVPWFLTYFSLLGFYPSEAVLGAAVPWLEMLGRYGGWILVLFGFVVFWTLIETATGIIHAFLARLDSGLREMSGRALSRQQRALIAVAALAAAVGMSRIGIIDLVARGYSMMAYGMIAIYAIPVLVLGLVSIRSPHE
jgi:uncharacterized membrane protein YkvI